MHAHKARRGNLGAGGFSDSFRIVKDDNPRFDEGTCTKDSWFSPRSLHKHREP